jgi:hypothetical protein
MVDQISNQVGGDVSGAVLTSRWCIPGYDVPPGLFVRTIWIGRAGELCVE